MTSARHADAAIRAGDMRFAYHRRGDGGPPVLLLHGWPPQTSEPYLGAGRVQTKLLIDAVPVGEPDDDMVDVQKAVKRVCCSTIESFASFSTGSSRGSVEASANTASQLFSCACPRSVRSCAGPWMDG